MKANRLFLPLLLVFLFLRISVIFNQPVGFDEGLYGYLSLLTKTQTPYIDFFDGKTPGIFYLGSLVLRFTPSIFALRLVSVSFQLFTLLVLFYLTKKSVGINVALLVAALFVFDPFLIVNSSYFITENFYAFFMIFAFLLYLQAPCLDHRSKIFLFLSGLMVGFSFLFKQSGAVVLFVFSLLEMINKRSFKDKFCRLVILVGGFLSILIPLILWLVAKLDLYEAYVTLYKANSWNISQSFPDFFRNRRDVLLGQMTFSIPLTLLSFLGLFYGFRDERRRWVAVWLIVLSLFLFLVIKGYTYMFIPLYPPMAILGGISLEQILGALHRKGFFILLPFLILLKVGPSKMLVVSAGLLAVCFLSRGHLIGVKNLATVLFLSSLLLFTINEYQIVIRQLRQGSVLLDDQVHIAKVISQNTTPDELIFSTNPGIAILADREVVPIKASYSGEENLFYGLLNYLEHPAAKFDLIRTIEDNKIRYLVFFSDDYKRDIVVNIREYLNCNFEMIKRIGAHDIYLRIPPKPKGCRNDII